MQKVVSILKEIAFPDIIICNINGKKENFSLKTSQSISNLSKETMDMNSDLNNINNKSLVLSNIELNLSNSESVISSQNQEDTMDSSGTSDQATTLSIDIYPNLEENRFITPDEKAKEFIKELAEPKFLYALKLLLENLQNEFSSQVLIESLEALIDPTPFDSTYSKESAARLELHLRTWVAVLERICFSPIVLDKTAGKCANRLWR